MDFFSNRSHSYHYDPDNGVIVELLENEVQNEFMRPFIETIRQQSITGDNQAKIAISWSAYSLQREQVYQDCNGLILSL